jgi:uncharacterized protein YkwD
MKSLVYAFSMMVCGLVAAAPPLAFAAAADPTPCAASAGYPSFCAIPHPPTDVRTAAQFRTAVDASRNAGQNLERSTAAMTWSLPAGGGAGFAAEARAEATPPAPMTEPQSDATDFARRTREEATPPPRPH